VLQLDAGALFNENELPPATFDAKVEIFFLTLALWQTGHTTSLAALALRTSSSNGFPHSAHTNSNIGIMFLLLADNFTRQTLDAQQDKRLQPPQGRELKRGLIGFLGGTTKTTRND
jgi:hypothetical protein